MTERIVPHVNGASHAVEVDPERPLLYALRGDPPPFTPERMKASLA
jgi:hypothetical protein